MMEQQPTQTRKEEGGLRMATHQPQREAEWILPDIDTEASSLNILESEFHNPKVGVLEDAGAKLSPDVIVIKVEA
jgi:hypothetical protein